MTMRRLILTRHAKSAWDDPLLDDHDRPLNERGRRSARHLGDWLASRGYEPEEVLCSDAARTVETWAGIAATPLEVLAELRMVPALYHASPDVMLATLRTATAHSVMILGHNPGIAEFAALIAANPPMRSDFRKYPTAATLVVDFGAGEWSDVDFGQGSVLDFFVPADAD